MKLLIISGLFFFSALMPDNPACDSLIIKTKITHTTAGGSNGEISVSVVKGKPPYKVFLFSEKIENNLFDVEMDDLINLSAGKYILVIQDAAICTTQEKLILK
jgi:hypothetical protein